MPLRPRLAVLLLATAFAAAPARAQSKLDAHSSSDDVLRALDERGKSLKSFTADVSLDKSDTATAATETRTGTVAYEQKSPGDARLHVVFETVKQEDGPVQKERVEYLLDNGWLTDRDYKRKTETRRQVLKPGEKVNLLKLGEGPFPLPIGQDPADVKREFEVSSENPAGSPELPHVRLTPKEGTRLARKFSVIDVWVDPATNMPSKIDTMTADGNTERGTELKNIKINPPDVEKEFKLDKLPDGWTLREEPYQD